MIASYNENSIELIAAPFTPMNNKGDLQLDIIPAYAKHLIEAGISGSFVCGTTGEGVSLTVDERKRILETWSKAAGTDLSIICHVGGNNLRECQQLAAHAEREGAAATASFAPAFFKPANVNELVSFLEIIAAAAPGIPFYYYHMPAMTGVNIPASELMKEAGSRIPNFEGIKYTNHDLYEMQKCLHLQETKYKVCSGHDEVFLCSLAVGAQSFIGSTYNYIARVYYRIWDAFRKGDMEEAIHWQHFSVQLVTLLIKYGGGVRAGKAIMKMIGLDCGPCRLPISPFTDEEFINMKSELDEMGFFSPNITAKTDKKREIPHGQ
jgi:N-acetylneuraminate lyase